MQAAHLIQPLSIVEDIWPHFERTFLSLKFSEYVPFNPIEIDTPKYHLTVASKFEHIYAAMQLRKDCFNLHLSGTDWDEFDCKCDHIIIYHKQTNELVGTYRVLSSLKSNEFYSQKEFLLDDFLNFEAVKLEVGRAAIKNQHRNGAVLDILWRGICKYIQETNTRYVFGCTSVKTVDADQANGLLEYIKLNGYYGEINGIQPRQKYKISSSSQLRHDVSCYKSKIPSLLRSYMSLGAKVYSEPALDEEFQCIDFLTIFDLNQASKSFLRRYMV